MNDNLMNTDLYEVLGVAIDASADEIAKAYKRLARENHPDVNPDDTAAEERFKGITAAYEVLGDAEKRAEYDEFRAMVGPGFDGDTFRGSTFTGSGFGPAGEQVFVGDIGDLLGGLFGSGFAGGGSAYGRPVPRRGSDIEASLSLDFDEAMRGTTRTLVVDGRSVNGRIPPGVRAGQRIRLAGQGVPGIDGGPAGDLYLVVSVEPHPVYGRSGRHLTIEVPIPYATAVLGGTVPVATYDGDPVTLKVPAGTSSGQTMRIRGRGVAGSDLLATVVIEVPTDLTPAQRAAVESMAAAFRSEVDEAA